MPRYYVNTQAHPNGFHDMHRQDCHFLPKESQRFFLGFYNRCSDAIEEAKTHYPRVNGCYYCSKECHRSDSR